MRPDSSWRGTAVIPGALALAVTLGSGFACVNPVHPSDPTAVAALCEPACAKRHGCNPADDYSSCLSYCRNFGSPRRIYYRRDLIESVRTCVERTACGSDLPRRMDAACFHDVFTELVPTPTATRFCERRLQKDLVCGANNMTLEKCLEGHKMYSDPILSQLDDCLGDASCRTYGRCLLGVVGPDAYWDDDRTKQWREQPADQPPPKTIRFAGQVLVDGGIPIAGATICVDERPDIACAATDGGGAFSLVLPTNQELAITVNAPGSVPELVPIRTGTRDMQRWTFVTDRVETQAARFSAIDAGEPGPQTTSLTVYTRTGDRRSGIDHLTVSMSPASGTGPFYFETHGEPSRDRHATSSAGSAMFANVAAGIVEIAVEPSAVTCMPGSAGWAAPTVNHVRAPVRPGYETWVTLTCHW